MAVVLQAIALISEPPGSYIYQVLLLCVLAVIAVRSAATGARRLTLAFCGLAGLRLGALIISLLTRDLPVYQLVIIPPFDRAVSWLTIFGLMWALTYPHTGRLSLSVAAGAVLLAGAAAVASWVLWVDAVGLGSVYYNGTLQDSLWLVAQLFLLIGGMIVLLRRQPASWQAGLGLCAVLFLSEVLHYLFPIADANVPGFVRFAELIVWPLAAVLLWRRRSDKSNPAALPIEAVAAPGLPTPFSHDIEMLRTELEAANRRNLQLRETNRQTRQQLAEAAAALAENRARLEEATPEQAATASSDLEKAELAREFEARIAGLEAALSTAASEAAGVMDEPSTSNQASQAQAQRIAQLEEQLAESRTRQQEDASARQAAEAHLVNLEATLLAAGDKSSEAAYLAQELNVVRQAAQSHTEQIASLTEQAAEARALRQEQSQARQAAEARLADAQAEAQSLAENIEKARLSADQQMALLRADLAAAEGQLAQKSQAEAALQADLHDSETALTEARRTSDRAQSQLSEQAIQLGVLQQQVAHLERLARERNGQVERRRPASTAAPKQDSPLAKEPKRPQNRTAGRETAAAGTNGQRGNGAVEHSMLDSINPLAAELRPELTPTIAGPVCAHLGLHTDQATRHAFPSEANRCYRLPTPAELTFEQQRSYCLSGAHNNCPIFTGQLVNPAVPIDTSPAPPLQPQAAKGLGRFFRRR
jgi:hypothetical protein